MDRFIAKEGYEIYEKLFNLKSNMDRFIGCFVIVFGLYSKYLKSNMDRFIVYQDMKKNI